MVIKIVPRETNAPSGKLAGAEVHFTDGVLAGLKLVGFGVWEAREGGRRNVTFPARAYQVKDGKRSFALVRPVDNAAALERARALVLQAYADYEAATRPARP